MTVYKLKTTIGIPRENLPQIEEEHFDNVIDLLDGNYDYEEKICKCSELKPSQDELNIDKISGMIKQKNHLNDRTLFISNDNFIVDGHHVWAARLTDDEDSEIDCIQVDMNIIDLINWLNTQDFTYTKNINEGKKDDS